MRVAHLLRKLDPYEWSGTEMAMQRLLEGLRTQGVSPVVYCPRIRHKAEDPLRRSGFEVRRFRAFVPVIGLPKERRRQLVSVGGNLMSFELCRSLWRERNLSVIHTHTLGRLGGIALTLAKGRKIPFVVTIHGGVLDLPKQVKDSFNAPPDTGWEWGKIFGVLFQARRLFRDADAILTCNPNEAKLLQDQFPRKRVVVQPHGVPFELYQKDRREAARAAFPQTENRRVLLCLGRIDPIKNQAWLLGQAPAFLQRHPDTSLVLAGPCTDEPYGEQIRRQIAQLGLGERVLLTGGMPPNDPRLIGLLQSAAVLLLPSVSETFGLVILEAWAAGTMVISTRASGPASLVKPGENGWLFDLDEPDGFHQALDRTLTDRDLSRRMVERGAALARSFSVDSLAGRMKSLYEELIEEKQCTM